MGVNQENYIDNHFNYSKNTRNSRGVALMQRHNAVVYHSLKIGWNNTMAWGKSRQRKGCRSRFKRTNNDERKKSECRRKGKEGRVALHPISSNISLTHTPLSFDVLKTDVPPDWVVYESEEALEFCLMKSNPPTVTRSVSVNADFTWYVHANKRVVSRHNTVIRKVWSGTPY